MISPRIVQSIAARACGLFCAGIFAWFSLFAEAAETNDFFPLMAWNWAPSDNDALLKMRECGLTVAGFVAPHDLDRCKAAGLKAIISDPRASNYDWKKVDQTAARANIASLVAEVGKHPAVYGYYLLDEPGADLFSGLAAVSALIREFAPQWPYINLFPNYANNAQLATSSYSDYLEKFVATCRPTTLSYDHYALMEDGSLRDGYWQNLQAMSDLSRKHRLPFWNIVSSVAHFNYREPTAADFRFQVYSTLAYGGKGIAYFTYFAPSVGNYRMAPIDQFGKQTPAWSSMQNVNHQVGKLAPTLLQLNHVETYHFGSPPPTCHGPSDKSLLSGVNSNDFMVGDFSTQSAARYVLIVNKNFTKSLRCEPQFRSPPKRVQMVSPYLGQLIDFVGEQKWVAPGQGILLKLD